MLRALSVSRHDRRRSDQTDAERTYAQARLGLVSAQVQQLQDTAGLLVALGGGWWKDPHDAAAPARLSSPQPPQAR